jgi:CheY-like chemotaxis protein
MPPLQTRRILLVDDDEVARQLVGHMLAALVKIVGTLIKL